MYSQKSKWALSSIIATYVTIMAIVGLGAWIYFIDEKSPYSYLCWGVISAWSVAAMFFCPLELRVDGASIHVTFCARVKSISLHEVERVESYKNVDRPKLCFGSAFFFGWWGVFRYPGIGRAMVYATDLDNVVRIWLSDGRLYVFSCADQEAMVSEIRRAVHAE